MDALKQLVKPLNSEYGEVRIDAPTDVSDCIFSNVQLTINAIARDVVWSSIVRYLFERLPLTTGTWPYGGTWTRYQVRADRVSDRQRAA